MFNSDDWKLQASPEPRLFEETEKEFDIFEAEKFWTHFDNDLYSDYLHANI